MLAAAQPGELEKRFSRADFDPGGCSIVVLELLRSRGSEPTRGKRGHDPKAKCAWPGVAFVLDRRRRIRKERETIRVLLSRPRRPAEPHSRAAVTRILQFCNECEQRETTNLTRKARKQVGWNQPFDRQRENSTEKKKTQGVASLCSLALLSLPLSLTSLSLSLSPPPPPPF